VRSRIVETLGKARAVPFPMDPLSITAAIIAIAQAAASTSRAFRVLRQLCKSLPARLHALGNEVADLEIVLHQLASVVDRRFRASTLAPHHATISHLLDAAGQKCTEITRIANCISDSARAKPNIVGSRAWRKNQPRLQELQEEVRNIKHDLNLMLGASNSQVAPWKSIDDQLTGDTART
jgi:hypothetical protein